MRHIKTDISVQSITPLFRSLYNLGIKNKIPNENYNQQ